MFHLAPCFFLMYPYTLSIFFNSFSYSAVYKMRPRKEIPVKNIPKKIQSAVPVVSVDKAACNNKTKKPAVAPHKVKKQIRMI